MAEKDFTQRMEVAGSELVERVKELAKDADARRVIIKDEHDKELLSVPLSWGVAGGAVALIGAPVLAAVAVIGGLAAKVKLEVERVGEDPAAGHQGIQDDPPPAGGDPHLPPPPPMS